MGSGNGRGASGDVAPAVLICLLGSFRVVKVGAQVTVRAGGKTEGLLSSLALQEGHRAPREWLLEQLWPDTDVTRALHALNSLVHAVRGLLGDALGGVAAIVYSCGAYELNADAGISVDVKDFEALVDRAARGFRAGDVPAAMEHSLRAVQLYQGDVCLVDGLRSLVERERLRALHLSLLCQMADQYFRDSEYGEALRFARRLLSNDPCREDAHRLVMRCHVRLGERAQAFRQYQVCRETLVSEFGVCPEPLTEALFDQVRHAPASV